MANRLTFLRLVLIAPFALLFAFDGAWARWLAFAIFLAAAATDFADGRIARARGETSALGAALDPTADKALAAAALLLLADAGVLTGLHIVPAVIIVVREILVSGLREALPAGSLPVASLAKVKTAVQFAAFALLLLAYATGGSIIAILGEDVLWAAAALSAWTGGAYVLSAFATLRRG